MATKLDATPEPLRKPPFRPLRTYAFDPTSPLSLYQALANEITLKVPWEDLEPGPIGEYVEVVDHDPESECFYTPVDLNAPAVLVENGLPPDEGVPQFHQQMVYALVMSTIRHFERGLGRAVLWSPHLFQQKDGTFRSEYVQRLRAYPHALRGQQTHYSPAKKALLMGYFPLQTTSAAGEPVRTTSFGCLSQGTVAHETAHAIVDGLGRSVGLADGGADQLAVQEAIADLTGLLQQFAVAGFLRDHVGFTSDPDVNERLLEAMARRLVQPVGVQAELRKRIGASDQQEQLHPRLPKFEERASALVAAVFTAFLAVWRKRCIRLFSLGGVAPIPGQRLAGELLEAVSAEAAKCASCMLHICIRAIDYCPPVDITMRDYLRALVTADSDLFPEDECSYRLTVVESFRRLGLYPSSTGSLLWLAPQNVMQLGRALDGEPAPVSSRKQEFMAQAHRLSQLHSWLNDGKHAPAPEALREMGLALGQDAPRTVERIGNGLPRVSIHSCRLARRIGADARLLTDWIVTITQRRRGYVDPAIQEAQDAGKRELRPDFFFRGGCTLVVDAATGQVRYCIAKDILANERLARRRESAQLGPAEPETARSQQQEGRAEPFLLLRSG
jgi:hypothetical protein